LDVLQEDLDTSVQKGLWATQKHNEGILERAFRTSKDVFLVFSVNKSGEFYGYARCVAISCLFLFPFLLQFALFPFLFSFALA
jgi:hypothetical protein